MSSLRRFVLVILVLWAMPAPVSAQGSTPVPAWLAFERAWTSIAAYSATVTVFDQEATQAQNVMLDFTFSKPSSAMLRVVSGPHAGSTLTWGGGSTVVARLGSGLLRIFSKTFALHDPAVTNLRGSGIDQMSFGAMIAHGRETAGVCSEATGPVIDGVPTEAITLTPTFPAADQGLTLEVIDIASTTNIPMRILGYNGTTLVHQIDFTNVKLQF
jgi:hypothetical protein